MQRKSVVSLKTRFFLRKRICAVALVSSPQPINMSPNVQMSLKAPFIVSINMKPSWTKCLLAWRLTILASEVSAALRGPKVVTPVCCVTWPWRLTHEPPCWTGSASPPQTSSLRSGWFWLGWFWSGWFWSGWFEPVFHHNYIRLSEGNQ